MTGRLVRDNEFTITVNRKLNEHGKVNAGELAEALGVSRQATHRRLRALVLTGQLEARGSGRGAHYVRAAGAGRESYAFPLEGAEEDRIWREVATASARVKRLSPNAERIISIGFSELFNNAIDHSGGTRALVRIDEADGRFAFEIEDDGEGVFRHVQRLRALPGPIEALQDLSKGKVTTAPERHTGMGLFFTARSMDRFWIESGTLRWTVDAVLDDTAFGEVPERSGTLVRCELAYDTPRVIKDVYDAFSDEELAFSKSKTWVKLFTSGLHFISRSEAKRLCEGLEKFELVYLDFKDVTTIGQAFADEVFRVWARAHPATKLVAENTVAPVRALIDAALRG